MQDLPNQEWMQPGEASRATGLTAQQIARLADGGKVHFIRPGKHRRYLRSDVEALLTAPTVSVAPPQASPGDGGGPPPSHDEAVA